VIVVNEKGDMMREGITPPVPPEAVSILADAPVPAAKAAVVQNGESLDDMVTKHHSRPPPVEKPMRSGPTVVRRQRPPISPVKIRTIETVKSGNHQTIEPKLRLRTGTRWTTMSCSPHQMMLLACGLMRRRTRRRLSEGRIPLIGKKTW